MSYAIRMYISIYACNLQDIQGLIKKPTKIELLEILYNLLPYLALIHQGLQRCQELFIELINYLLYISGVYCNLHCI